MSVTNIIQADLKSVGELTPVDLTPSDSSVTALELREAQPETDTTIPKLDTSSSSLESSSSSTSCTSFSSIAATPTSPSDSCFSGTWRPEYHITAPRGWLNDPCAPGYNRHGSVYSLGFQWNPYDHKWGNISWGSAISHDLVNWTVSDYPAMEPTPTMDSDGVFTGCILQQPYFADTDPYQVANSETAPTTSIAFYTSARKLPITYKDPYTRGSEQLRLATSMDHGRTWQRAEESLILAEPPAELGSSVRGWRDPYVSTWDAMDQVLRQEDNNDDDNDDPGPGLYGTISGSMHNQTPTVFLYQLDRKNLKRWQFLGPLIEIPVNFSPSPWSGDFGVNWEVANFVDLVDEASGSAYTILIAGVEGVRKPPAGIVQQDRSELILEHKQMWMCGTLARLDTGKSVRLQYKFGGLLDHGCFYAANGFRDPVSGNFVTLGWIFEEDLSADLVAQQGWSGCLSIPRVISIKSLRNVTRCLRSNIGEDLGCFGVEEERQHPGAFKLTLLGISPDPRLSLLRSGHELRVKEDETISWFENPMMQRHWEFRGSFRLASSSSAVGMEIAHDEAFTTSTSIIFNPISETITVDRSRSTSVAGINTVPEVARHTLFSFTNGTSEALDLHVFFDVSVFEIFVNGRTAISTRVYPSNGKCFGVRWILQEDKKPAMGFGLASGRDRGGAARLEQNTLAGLGCCNNNDDRPVRSKMDGVFWALKDAVRFVES